MAPLLFRRDPSIATFEPSDVKGVLVAVHQVVRVAGLLLTVLGVLFWSDHARTLIPLYFVVGVMLAVALWVLAFVASRLGAGPSLVIPAVFLGFVVPSVGLTDDWALYLLGGPSAIATAEGLVSRARAHWGQATRTEANNGGQH